MRGARRAQARTLRGRLDQVIEEGEQAGDAYLRVILAEQARAGLGDLVREKLPNVLEVQLDEVHRPRPGTHGGPDRPSRAGRTPVQLFGDYLGEQNVGDERVERMFAELLEEMTDGSGSVAGLRSCFSEDLALAAFVGIFVPAWRTSFSRCSDR